MALFSVRNKTTVNLFILLVSFLFLIFHNCPQQGGIGRQLPVTVSVIIFGYNII